MLCSCQWHYKDFFNVLPVVKATLFRTFCNNTYCSQLWRDVRSGSIRQLFVGYNHSFRYIMNHPRNCSASGMFVFNNIPSFMELWRNWGVSRKLATFEKMTVTGMNLRDLNVLLLHYPFMSNPRCCLGCATKQN